jgi:endonuclease-3
VGISDHAVPVACVKKNPKGAEVAMKPQNEKIAEIIKMLKKEYPGTPQTVLRFSTPFELLVATILSAQTTDVLVNRVTADLF